MKSAKRAELLAAAHEAEAADHRLALGKAARTTREWRAAAEKMQRELELAERRLEVALAIKPPVERVRIAPPRKADPGRAIAGAIASDWHVGEVVERTAVSGKNAYRPAIAERRAHEFWRRLVRLVEIQRSGARIEDLFLHLAGDLIGGYIHEDLRLTNELSPTEEIRFAKRLVTEGLEYLLDHGFKRIIVAGSYGNHGRTNPGRPLVAAAARNSFEWMAYHDLAESFAKEPRISWHIAAGPFLYVDLEGFVIRCTHGDTFRYAGGIGGLTIPLVKALHRWDTVERAHLTLMGHWHQFMALPRAIVNGSLKGFDAWAAHIGAEYEPAQQAFFLIDPKRRRRTVAEPIFVE